MQYRPHHTAISVRSLEASLDFYGQLGFKQVHRYDEADGSMSIVHLKLGDSYLELFNYKANKIKDQLDYAYANDLEDIGLKHIALKVDDIESALQDLRSKGLANSETSIEASGTRKAWWFFIKDPDGMWVEIIKDNRYE